MPLTPDPMIAAFVQEMSHIFRDHKRSHTPRDIAGLTLAQAYAVQDGFVVERLRSQGEVVGWKIGCTSAAIREQFGLSQPISGRLFEREMFHDGAVLPASAYVDCAVEPEI